MKIESLDSTTILAQNSTHPAGAAPVAPATKTALGLGLSGFWLVLMIAVLGFLVFLPTMIRNRRARHQPRKDQVHSI